MLYDPRAGVQLMTSRMLDAREYIAVVGISLIFGAERENLVPGLGRGRARRAVLAFQLVSCRVCAAPKFP